MKENNILSSKGVIEEIEKEILSIIQCYEAKTIIPTLAVLRVGQNPADLSYEKGLTKKMNKLGIQVKIIALPKSISTSEMVGKMNDLNTDNLIHGILMFRPLPKHLDEQLIKNSISEEKDIDCMSSLSLGKLLEGDFTGYVPCTALSVIRILQANEIDLKGKNVTVVGRSTVIGKPVALLALKENATVTICHSKTKNLNQTTRKADILICALGKAKLINKDFVKSGMIIADVGINIDNDGNLCGDLDSHSLEGLGISYTPVPGGVGSVTTSILALQVMKACLLQNPKN